MNRILPVVGMIALLAGTGCLGRRACGPCGNSNPYGVNYAPTQNYNQGYTQQYMQPSYNPGCPTGNCGSSGGMWPSSSLTPIPESASIIAPTTTTYATPTTTHYSPTVFQPQPSYSRTVSLDYGATH